MMTKTLKLIVLLGALAATPLSSAAQEGSPPAQRGAALPPAYDLGAVHAYVEALAYDADEGRAMAGFNALVAGGEPYADPLAQLFLHAEGDVRCRWVAGQALGRLRSATAVTAIERGLTDSLPLARIASLEGTVLQRPPGARERLERGLKDPAAVVRASAADALARLGDPQAVPSLVTAWADPLNVHKGHSLFVRANILDALGALRARSAAGILLEGLEDPEPSVQEAARRALIATSGLPAAPPGTSPEVERWRAYLGL